MSPEEKATWLTQPAMPAPSGVEPNFEHPKSSFSYAFPMYLLVFIISNTCFGMKMFAQIRIFKQIRFEDWMLLIGWLVYASAFFPFGTMACFLPVGVHQWEMLNERYVRNLFVYSLTFPAYGIIMIFVKTNILLQYARLFVPNGLRTFTWWGSMALIGLNVLFYTGYTFSTILMCIPRKKFWDPTVEGGQCLDWAVLLATGNSITLVSDILILLLPQRVIFKLQLTRSRRLGLSALFIIGLFACLSSTIRVYYHIKFLEVRTDNTYFLGKIAFWATCQLTSGFLVACLPAVPVVANHIKQKDWAIRMASSVRSILHVSQKSNDSEPTNNATTIGGNKHKHNVRVKQATDLEFEELVRKTELSSLASVSRNEMDWEQRRHEPV
ncbi:hypothetical protein P280DRAFT_477345 [Massarina eburnea CBS 473.64]|uniref:Rhodopsin domain-containing protein n=1 Tax=Massarina eburnea CBS 473.64 TaxID=1395130 RepID=A0A6A6S7Q6_9PLEO|nr:hypothetical protein P280DRAFT_477345 [Massarina eburnea CBS 473.64]